MGPDQEDVANIIHRAEWHMTCPGTLPPEGGTWLLNYHVTSQTTVMLAVSS